MPESRGGLGRMPYARGRERRASQKLAGTDEYKRYSRDLVRRQITTDYTVGPTDDLIMADTPFGGITITLPPAAGSDGRILWIKSHYQAADGVVVDGNGSEKVDGLETVTLESREAVTLYCDGIAWWILAHNI